MRIGINTLFESPLSGTGGLSYIRDLTLGLSRVDRENEYVLFVSPLNQHLFPTEAPNFRHVLCPFSKEKRLSEILYEHTRLPLLARKHGVEVLHSPGNIAPIWLPMASVVTLHTVHHYIVPQMMARSSMLFRRAMMPHTLRRADKIITISDFVRNTLQRLLHVPADRMVTVYHGVEQPAGNGHRPLPQLPAKYILFVSALWPYKNAARLVEAFALLKREGIPHKLVVVGSGWESCRREVEQVARAQGVTDDVILTGRVPEVWPYYHHADVFVYPSLHEEFGLPMLEAMLAGVPVVAANRGALPEIAGDAGVITAPEDPAQIAAAIRTILRDEGLRRDLIARGHQRTASFKWDKTARRTIEVYGEALARWKNTRGRQ